MISPSSGDGGVALQAVSYYDEVPRESLYT